MRLTLRTMLAYLDDILVPADAQALGRKIEESEFATSLMHRMRDVTRRLRLPAPRLEGRGMGLDPNTVAEYLDNTLPHERVPDFEKVCLESDVHLAEVASAHQVLALVLGEPAEVDQRSRLRMYGLISSRESAKESPSAVPAASAASQSQGPSEAKRGGRRRKRRRQPKVPHYLKDTSAPRGSRRLLAVSVVALLVGGALFLALGPRDVQLWFGRQIASRSGTVGSNDKNATASQSSEAPADQTRNQRTSGAANRSEDQAAGSSNSAHTKPRDGATATRQKPKPASGSAKSTRRPSPLAPAKGASGPDHTQPAAATPEGAREGGAEEPPVPGDASAAPTPGESTGENGADKPVAKPEPQTAQPIGEPAPPAEGVGRLISEKDVLLRLDRASGRWLRLPSRDTVYSGDKLMALPTYRANVALGVGVTLQLLGGTVVDLEAPDQRGVPGIVIERGRVILLTVAKPDTRARIRTPDQHVTVTFGQGDATLAVQVASEPVEGGNPEEAATRIDDLFVATGSVDLAADSGAQAEWIEAPAHRRLTGPPLEGGEGDAGEVHLPGWIAADELSGAEKMASAEIEDYVGAERPVALALKELVAHRRIENRRLALLCLAEMGEFDSLVSALSDTSLKTAWPTLVESLRNAMARAPAVAAQVRAALEVQRGAKAAELYRMLWGYTPAQLSAGDAEQLVKFLDHEDLDFRVLSFWNLQHVSGGAGLFYRPEYNELKRKQYVQKWRDRLERNAIVPKAPAG